MIWVPALAALGAMRASLLESERRQQNLSAPALPRHQLNLQCSQLETLCQRLRLFAENGEQTLDCEGVVQYGLDCLYIPRL